MTPKIRPGLALVLGAAALASCGSDSTGPPPEPLEITTTSLPDGRLDQPYTAGINADGGRLGYEWSISQGSLPPGLALSIEDLPDGDDVVITGTPEALGNFTFSVRVTSSDGQTDTRQLGIQILEPTALAITNPALAPALRGGPYSVQLDAAGGPSGTYTWSVAAGSLPAGLTLASDGRIQGTPTATDTAAVTFRVQSGTETATRAFSMVVVANRTTTYDITPLAVTTIPATIQPHVDAAIAEWEAILTGDLVAITIPTTFFAAQHCGGFGKVANGTTVDDILVLINIAEIDGPGGILGQAGPCAIRDSSRLPVVGIVTLDSEDLLPLVGTQTLTHIITHEIGHVLGFGSLWGADLLTGAGTSDPRYTGAAAVAEWHALGGTGDVPVEGTGGEGTADSHWRESTFDRELMTGYSEVVGVFQPLSRVTIGALDDLGYQVNYDAADAYTLSFGLLAPDAAMLRNLGRDVVLDQPVLVIPESARIQLPTRMRGTP
ncbi:MAG TPA: putative Ig domain-containing protein [Longimicrobiales bacterium]|nr:putative Ig domain-containing protein [Longimicrobiales bacterium]